MIERLKEETRDLHEQIEDKNLASRIMDHTIDLNTYKLLLLQNYLAYLQTETEIKKFLPQYKGSKHLQIKQDLEQLNVSTKSPSKNDSFECHSMPEALGAAYVVEGSALGGMVLAKNIDKCPALEGVNRHFFFNGEKQNIKDWQEFKKQIEKCTFTKEEESVVIEKAKETFRFFERIFDSEYRLS